MNSLNIQTFQCLLKDILLVRNAIDETISQTKADAENHWTITFVKFKSVMIHDIMLND